ncbi:MAG TPA: hypothetical protein VFD54_03100 [Anaerolineales bacterium]|nr:hypothetical protein [Anaerolineales bacterium]
MKQKPDELEFIRFAKSVNPLSPPPSTGCYAKDGGLSITARDTSDYLTEELSN